jgi:maltose alpha-D-glucosyltransferase/alpha-amylase
MAQQKKSNLASDPLWYKDAIIYQLHVKSFFDANNDGVGDFAGLLTKLDYVASLGVDTIWLLPFYPSPRKDDGYDIAEYRKVHSEYGTIAEVKELIRAAHERGLHVITELVINHTSDQHPWFQRARRSKPGSSARNFYVWSDSDHKYEQTRIIFIDTEKSNWTWDPVAGAYFWHRFYSHQPDLNFDNPMVLKAVLSVMKFWLEMGIDGLRLDAIPYLIERDNTINENLPETHAILKEIRAALDSSFENRLLLAEANQWPEDTQEYFGNGDECHMAFHFPLMPRMYMAIAQEDRFPITDIMRQTPEIPGNCQWAIFLRNHDELTLEMVTDAERDYLWKFYAADRRARLNLGIRRRLAPLLERDRRRIELMNGLLLSMPGTPVVYYGDEIGMGDNIHLGDRDGVRTPMQWSADRNGGFSRADPASLVLPLIMDPVYGFEAVNVEAQSRDPHSLLNWMRRMLSLRRRHRAFGRGKLRFLYPGNRKILAYLREHEDDVILCVANLSRTPQAVELDLSTFGGRVPVEMTGPSAFPPIGQLTYLLTMPPYGFYWFQLMEDAKEPAWRNAPPEQMPEFTTLVLRSGLRDVLTEKLATTITEEVLPSYLPRRRWFGAKNEVLDQAHIAYAAEIPGAEEVMITEIEATVGGSSERYLVPLGIAWEDEPHPALSVQLALARVRRVRRVGYLTDAFSLESFVRALLRALSEGTKIDSPEGEIRFLGTELLDSLSGIDVEDINWLSTEQSNSSLLIGNKAMVKLIRKVLPGIHPEAEMTRHLSNAGYGNSAALLGEVVRVAADGTPHTLAIVQRAVRNQGEAWNFVLDELRRTVEEVALQEEERWPESPFAKLEEFARVVGTRLGELHLVLAADTADEAFAPAIATATDAAGWGRAAQAQILAAFDALKAYRAAAEPALEPVLEELLEKRQGLLDAASRLAEGGEGMHMTRIHGDFHLGQVLLVEGDAYIIDFEGEPARSLEERRAKASPLRDVAGFLRSIDYAAATIADLDEGADPLRERRHALLGQFRESAEQAFLSGYEAAVGSGESLVEGRNARLLELFLLHKAAYEVCYEAASRPKWISVPLRGLAQVAKRLSPEMAGV